MGSTRARVGLDVPGRVTATWPLIGLRFDDEGFDLAVPAVTRLMAGSACPSSCDWRDVESVRRNGSSIEVRLSDRRLLRITAFGGGKAVAFVEAGRAQGVRNEREE